MMKLNLAKLTAVVFAITLSNNAAADIDADAAFASHTLEQATSYANVYVNTFYGDDYDSDPLKEETEKLHNIIHDYQGGSATETEVAEQMLATKNAWNTFRQTINSSGILNSGDYECDLLYQRLKETYKEVRHLVNGTQSAK